MNTIYYFYILKCKDGTKYYGHTNNLLERLKKHKKGRVFYTRHKQLELVYYEKFALRSEAYKREMQFKNGKTRKETIEKLINSFPKTKCQGFNSQTALPSSMSRPMILDKLVKYHLLIKGGKDAKAKIFITPFK